MLRPTRIRDFIVNTIDVVQQVKQKCRMVKPIGKGWYQSIYHHLYFAHKLDKVNGILRITIPHVAKSSDYNIEKLISAINETNCEVRYIKATILPNGSISISYDHKIADGEIASIIVPHMISTLYIASECLLLKLQSL